MMNKVFVPLLICISSSTESLLLPNFVTKRSGESIRLFNRRTMSSSSTQSLDLLMTYSSTSENPPSSLGPTISDTVQKATETLEHYDILQQKFMKENPVGRGSGTSALTFLQHHLSYNDRLRMMESITKLVHLANGQRSADQSKGRILLGICAENVDEALLGIKSWVTSLSLPRGLLHGMDVDGVPISPEELGSVYVKYNTGGSMTFKELRERGIGFDSLWKPGDAVIEKYDGDFRGVYVNVELDDGVFRNFGVFPTDLWFEEEEDW